MMEITLSVLFWGYVMAYCVHIIKEVAVGEGFVEMMRKTFYPGYSGRMFFGFNLMIFLVFVAGIIVYEMFGGVWMIWPLSFVFMFVTNGLWHLIQTIAHPKVFARTDYEPHLLDSLVFHYPIFFVAR